jgi:Ca-activated chloride channel family protein
MWNKKEETVEQEGRDLFIALDISRSMLAPDCLPNRLMCAKSKIKKLLPMLSCERVGLILFSGSSIIQCPLTTDYGAFLMFLEAIDAETVSAGTTALDQAIAKAMDAFGLMKDKKNKLLVIFTDGEDFSSNLAGIKQDAIKKGLHIFTVGVGTQEGAPIPLYDAYGKQIGHQLDDRGNVVITHLNEGILRSVAQDSGSIYLTLTTDDSDLRSLVRAVTSFEKEKIEDKKISMLEDQYHYFLLISLFCLLLEWIL